ncbi:MAG: nuclear transport factor 2 family protein [Bacteroidota bacterium]
MLMVDQENDAATAKVEIKMGERLYIDYFLLLKLEGTWTIIHKSYTRKE